MAMCGLRCGFWFSGLHNLSGACSQGPDSRMIWHQQLRWVIGILSRVFEPILIGGFCVALSITRLWWFWWPSLSHFDFQRKRKICVVDLTALKTWIFQDHQNIQKMNC